MEKSEALGSEGMAKCANLPGISNYCISRMNDRHLILVFLAQYFVSEVNWFII